MHECSINDELPSTVGDNSNMATLDVDAQADLTLGFPGYGV